MSVGKNVPVNIISQERRQSAIDHIKRFPTVYSNYSRVNSPYRKYLPPGLCINTMYNMYLDLLAENESEIQPVSDRCYRDIFNSEFNVGFEPPYNDTSTTCDLINRYIC